MANPANLKPWPKGVSGNPAGCVPRLPPEIRAERKKNQAALILLVSKLFALNPVQSKKNERRRSVTQLELSVQGLITKAKKGDTNAFRYLIELVCGKIPEVDQETVGDQMTPEEKLDLMKRAVSALEEQVKSSGSGSNQPTS